MQHPSLAVLSKDPRFLALIQTYGEPALDRGLQPFAALVRAIIYQQVTGAAAATILARFKALFPGKKFPTPQEVLALSPEALRGAGLSGQKVSYIQDLALKFSEGVIVPKTLTRMTNEEVTAVLTSVKGVGVWTAHMFLIFTLGRLDVLPTGDLGIQKGFQSVYKLRTLPDHAKMECLAKPWRAHASAASWYLWRAADAAKLNAKVKRKPKKKVTQG